MKNRVRKMVLLSSCVLLMAACLAGCGDKPADETASGEQVSQNETTQSENVVAEEEDGTEAAEEVAEGDEYALLWSDEFDGTELDMTTWNYEPHEPGWTNEELQEYTTSTDNVYIEDGCLVIQALETVDASGEPYYTSGKVTTQNKQDFLYGKVVVSAKVPEGQGLWPAIWMMPTDESYYGQWPKCGEIDIMEVLGDQTNTAYGTIHYGEPHAEQQGIYVLENGTFADDFHEYSVEWEPGEMRFYIDGNLYHTVNDWFTCVQGEEDKPYPAPFDQTFFVQMNLAVGGVWPGNPDETTDFDNAKFYIDYVRVYQKPEYDTNVTKPESVFREPTEDGNLIYNGDFAEEEDLTDEINWNFLEFEGGVGSAEIADGMLIVSTEEEGTEDYSIQIVQREIPIYNGSSYRVTFEASSEEDRDVVVCVSAPNAGWIRYLQDTTFQTTTDWQTYEYEFTVTDKDDPLGRLEFNMGNKGSTATVYIRNVRIEIVE